jgi:uncharacterized protein DUF3300
MSALARASLLHLLLILVLLCRHMPVKAQDAPSGQNPKPFSKEELDALVAPIALYPDSLLAQVFMAPPIRWR